MSNERQTPGLSDEQIDALKAKHLDWYPQYGIEGHREFARAIERAAGTSAPDDRDETIRNLTRALREATEGESMTSMVRRHQIKAADCPPGIFVVPVYSLLRLATPITGRSAEPEPVRAALAELVACKDLKVQIERFSLAHMPDFPPSLDGMRAEYERRQPLAWEAARRALAQSQSKT